MSNYKFDRRKFITGAGTIFTLPLLEAMFPFSKAFAQAAADPRRYVVFYLPNGTYNREDRPLWTPRVGTISASNTTDVFSPFSAFYGDFSVVNGMKSVARRSINNGDDHEAHAITYLTCASAITSTTSSIDQILSDRLGKKLYHLHGGDFRGDLPADPFVSYRNGQMVRGMANPGDLYRDLMGRIVTSPAPTPVANNDKSILDSSLADINSLKSCVGLKDQQKLDEYFTAIRELEAKIAGAPVSGGSTSAACTTPTLDPKVDTNLYTTPSLYLPRFYAFNDMIKIAFACDVSRVISIMVDSETTGRNFEPAPANLTFNGVNIGGLSSHIAISHSATNSGQVDRVIVRDRVLLQIVMDLVSKLKSANDPSGSRILDNTIIQAGYGIVDGNHSYWWGPSDVGPMILAGGRNFASPGRSVMMSGVDMRDFYFTINNILGAKLANFQGSSRVISL